MKILTVFGSGSEDSEFVVTVDILRRGGASVTLSSIDEIYPTLSHKIVVKADNLFKDLTVDECLKYDALFIPGGKAAFTTMHKMDKLIDLVRKFYENKKIVASICAAPSIFGLAGILDNKKFTCYDGFEEYMKKGINLKDEGAVRDMNIITGKSMNYTVEFALLFLEALEGKEKSEMVKKGILRK